MPTREEKIAFIQSRMGGQAPQSSGPTREEKIAFIQQRLAGQSQEAPKELGIGETIDSYTGAPSRAFVGAAQDGQNPFKAFANQWGEDPANAPTMERVLEKAGMPETVRGTVSPNIPGAEEYEREVDLPVRQAAGVVGDIVTDWTNLIPAVGPIKKAIQGTESGGKVFAKAAKVGAKAGEIASKGSEFAGRGAVKLGEAFTGVTEKEIRTYSKHADEIKQMAKSSDNNVAEAADQIRAKFADSIDATRKAKNSEIDAALKSSNKTVEAKPVIEALEKTKSGLDADIHGKAISEIDNMIELVKKKEVRSTNSYGQRSLPTGQIPVQDANRIKTFLQDKATAAYRKPGEIFNLSPESARSAQSGAATIRKGINTAEPAVQKANETLAELHDIEDLMNSNLIAEGKPEAALVSAGSGGNQRNAKNLQRLGDLTGTDMLGEAEKLAAMRTFGSPKLMAADVTGKAGARMALAGAIGTVLGGPVSGVVSAALTSPAALRAAIDSGKISKKVLSAIGQTAEGKQLLTKAYALEKSAQVASQNRGEVLMFKRAAEKEEESKKGPDKWANDGLEKLINHADQATRSKLQSNPEALFSDPKTKDLLIKASDLKPGSKAMDEIMSKIKNRVSKGQE